MPHYLSPALPSRPWCRLSVTSLANGGHRLVQLHTLSLILISITKFDSPGHRADTCDSLQPSDWSESRLKALSLTRRLTVLIRAGYSLVKRIFYID